jgi:TonB family protein
MTIDSLRQQAAKHLHAFKTRHWPKLVAELETKSLRSLFFRALLLGLIVSVPWQCTRMVYNAYFTDSTEQQSEESAPLTTPKLHSGSITKMPSPRARRPVAAPVNPAPVADQSKPETNTAQDQTAQVAHPDQDVKIIHQEPPTYPADALRKNESGTVQLRVAIDKDGVPEDINIESSSGSRALDRAARSAIAKWRFSPKFENGAAVPSEILIPVEFKADQ